MGHGWKVTKQNGGPRHIPGQEEARVQRKEPWEGQPWVLRAPPSLDWTRDEMSGPSVGNPVSSHKAWELGQRTQLGDQGAEAEAAIWMTSPFKQKWDQKSQWAAREK